MPVYKFRSFEEAERALWLTPGDPNTMDAMKAVYQLSKLAPDVPPERGVRRFRSIQEANTDRNEWERQIVAAARARPRLR